MNFSGVTVDLMQMQNRGGAVRFDRDIPLSGQFPADRRFDLLQGFLCGRLVKSNGDTVHIGDMEFEYQSAETGR